MQFTDEICEHLFGAEDAENEEPERFVEYFYYNKSYENIKSNLPIRILVGPKGVGKSAILRRAHISDKDEGLLTIFIQTKSLKLSTGNNDFVNNVEAWKEHLLSVIGKQVIESLYQEPKENLLDEIPSSRGVIKWMDFLLDKARKKAEEKLPGVNETLIQTFLQNKEIRIYIDDIDRGWSASKEDIRNISALLNAMRDISGEDRSIKFRIALRSDVYFLVRTSDESTDKIERNVVWLDWENHEILCIIAKRIETFFNIATDETTLIKMPQKRISNEILSKIITETFDGKGHWSNRPIHNVLLSLTRKRPRDLVKLMYGAARKAYSNNNEKITTYDLESSFEFYSNERLQDIINEYKSELPEIKKLLLGMRPTKKQRTTKESFYFTNDTIITKIKGIMSQTNLRFTGDTITTPKSLLQFLYKIGFVTATIKADDGNIERKYFDQSRFVADELADFGYNWEIHPAYRWALQPQDINGILDSVEIGNNE